MIRNSAPAERNKQPILQILSAHLPSPATVLEIASGTGQHAVYFAKKLTGVTWLPTERNSHSSVDLIDRLQQARVFNIESPQLLDASSVWPNYQVDAVYSANLTHISPFSATEGLIQGAAQSLNPQGQLFVYGPFKRNGAHMSQGNVDFDRSLREQNEQWGIRDMETIQQLASAASLDTVAVFEMPANNLMLQFRMS